MSAQRVYKRTMYAATILMVAVLLKVQSSQETADLRLLYSDSCRAVTKSLRHISHSVALMLHDVRSGTCEKLHVMCVHSPGIVNRHSSTHITSVDRCLRAIRRAQTTSRPADAPRLVLHAYEMSKSIMIEAQLTHLQGYDVWMHAKVAHEPDLTQHMLGIHRLLCHWRDLLDSHTLVIARV
jgi:hypothetical protein